MIIPDSIVSLSPAEAYRFYRDELNWHVYPVYPPWNHKAKDPGKQPAIKEWWNWDPHDCDIPRFFPGNGQSTRAYNMGVACGPKVRFLDIDSKADSGASARAFVASNPRLSNAPTHLTRGGAHIPVICPDVPALIHPRNGKPYYDALNASLDEHTTAEFFHSDHTNLVLPPSIHLLDSFQYVWTVFGEVPVLDWKELQSIFNFELPSAKPSGSKAKSKWYEAYRGDLDSLDLKINRRSPGCAGRLPKFDF